jgi:hypothetical protein
MRAGSAAPETPGEGIDISVVRLYSFQPHFRHIDVSRSIVIYELANPEMGICGDVVRAA